MNEIEQAVIAIRGTESPRTVWLGAHGGIMNSKFTLLIYQQRVRKLTLEVL